MSKEFGKYCGYLKKHKTECVVLVIGIVLMVVSGIIESSISAEKNEESVSYKYTDNAAVSAAEENVAILNYADAEAERLETFLKTIEGVGDADVIIYVDTSFKTVNATEESVSNSSIDESDSNGGTRSSVTCDESVTYKVIKDSSGNESVVPVYTEYPEIIGVVVSADGAESGVTKEKILNAVKALYGVPAHKVEVFEKGEN